MKTARVKESAKSSHGNPKRSGMTIGTCTGAPPDPVFGDLYLRRRSDKSFFGYDPSVLKSGIQKYARRAEVGKGLWCLVEMDLFSLLEKDGPALEAYLRRYPNETNAKAKSKAKRVRTNMINRLVVMMSEEVNICAWWMPTKVLELYEKWNNTRNIDHSRKYLVDLYLYLTSQSMIRLISDLKSVFLLPPHYLEADKMDDLIEIHEKILGRYPQIYSTQAQIGAVEWNIDMARYPKDLHLCINGIMYNLDNCSDNVFYWISRLYALRPADMTEKKWESMVGKIVWEILHRFIDRNGNYKFVRPTICALQEFDLKMKHKEKPIYLYHAVLLLVRRNEIDWSSAPPPIDNPFLDVMKMYADHFSGGKMAIDGYVLDRHTKGGKRSGNSLENFALEGAYIKHENTTFLNPAYREIYVSMKKELDAYHGRGGKLQ